MVTSLKAVGKYFPHFTLTGLMLSFDTLRSHHFAQAICSCTFISFQVQLFLRLHGLSEGIINTTSSSILYIMEHLSWDFLLFGWFFKACVSPVSVRHFRACLAYILAQRESVVQSLIQRSH